MPGRVFDLSDPHVQLTSRLAFDTNVLAVRFFAPQKVTPELARRRLQVNNLIESIRVLQIGAVITPTAFRELVHVAIRSRYKRDLAIHSASVGGKKSWELLFKARPDLLQSYEGYLRRLPSVLASMGILVVQPFGVEAVQPRGPFENELIDFVVRYQLNSGDASILLEMRHAGIESIVTEDQDLRRASTDFNVYSWL